MTRFAPQMPAFGSAYEMPISDGGNPGYPVVEKNPDSAPAGGP